MFRDYVSTMDELRRLAKKSKELANKLTRDEIDIRSYEAVYGLEIRACKLGGDPFARARLIAELEWYRCKRPFFNIYPTIEDKFTNLDLELGMNELHLPFKTLELRTTSQTCLLSDMGDKFLFVVELGCRNKQQLGAYQEFVCDKTKNLRDILAGEFRSFNNHAGAFASDVDGLDAAARKRWVYIATGTCLLAADKTIVQPVILRNHRRDDMTPAEIAKYAEKAITRNGRIGFDVGREVERMKATIHYRNGCFAKYYVAKGHEAYPATADTDKVAIIKWRSGAVVNKANVPHVPTGFKGDDRGDA